MELKIGWLYPTLLNTYGDRGNVLCLQKRLQWRRITCTVNSIDVETSVSALENMDLLIGGGAQDWQQSIVMKDLSSGKADLLKQKLKDKTPALFTCGFFQLLGRYYKTAAGKSIEGLGLLDYFTVHPGFEVQRCVGNVVLKATARQLSLDLKKRHGSIPYIIGFENHGGCTFLGQAEPLGKVIKGYGNNGEDGTEGVFFENMIGTYAHGPLLPKNPFLADWLIEKALEKKYNASVALESLEDIYAYKARRYLFRRMGLASRS